VITPSRHEWLAGLLAAGRRRRALQAAGAALTLVLLAVGYGLSLVLTPEPEPRVETKVLDFPPACREVGPAVQTERATAASLAEAHERSVAQSEAYGAAVLSTDPDEIDKKAKALDQALRAEQELVLGLATDQATTDATVGDCTPERAQ